MTSYCSTTDVRLMIGISTLSTDPDWISNETLQNYIDKSGPLLLRDISVLKVDEVLSGNIDGSNTTFETSCYPIADQDYDSTINANDVTLYSWTDSDDPSTKSELTISTVYANDGKIVVNAAISSDVDQVTASYRFYRQDSMDFSALVTAQSYLAGWLFVSSEYDLLPEKEQVGVHRWQYTKMPSDRILEHYYMVMNLIKSKSWEKIKSPTPQMIRR